MKRSREVNVHDRPIVPVPVEFSKTSPMAGFSTPAMTLSSWGRAYVESKSLLVMHLCPIARTEERSAYLGAVPREITEHSSSSLADDQSPPATTGMMNLVRITQIHEKPMHCPSGGISAVLNLAKSHLILVPPGLKCIEHDRTMARYVALDNRLQLSLEDD